MFDRGSDEIFVTLEVCWWNHRSSADGLLVAVSLFSENVFFINVLSDDISSVVFEDAKVEVEGFLNFSSTSSRCSLL